MIVKIIDILFTMIEKHFKNKLQNHCYMRDKVGAVISSKDESEAKEILKYLMLKSIFFVRNYYCPLNHNSPIATP